MGLKSLGEIPKGKIVSVVFGIGVGAGLFFVGRKTAPKPTTEIQYVDRIKYVKEEKKEEKSEVKTNEHAEAQKDKQSKGHVVIVQRTTKGKDGKTHTVTKKTIDYDSSTKSDQKDDIDVVKNTQKKTDTHITKDETKKEDIKQTYPDSSDSGITYTFLVGRSFSDARTDYEGFVGVPVLWNLFKVDVGYEYLDKRMFLGATVTF